MNHCKASSFDALNKLRMPRSEKNQFASKIEFDQWADNVKAAIAADDRARRQFQNYAVAVETMYAFKSDPLNAINNAIGLVNEVAMVWQQKSSQNIIENSAEVEAGGNRETVPEIPATGRFSKFKKYFASKAQPAFEFLLKNGVTLLIEIIKKRS